MESTFLRLEAAFPSTDASTSSTSTDDTPGGSNESETDFQAYLDLLAGSQAAEPRPSSSAAKLQSCLTEIERLGRVKGSNVFDIINLYPEMIRPVARTVSSLPSTQVSVERIFSHLKLILRENRSRMAADLAEAILFLRTNKCV